MSTQSPEHPPGPATTRPTREEALRAAEEAWRAEENERARAQLRDMKPWRGKAQRQDRVLVWLAVTIPAFFLLTMPLRPLFIADHPVPLALATGGYGAIGAGAALASVGQETLWVVVLAGVVGKIKIDWLFWWLGHRWGRGIVRFLVQGERARRWADRLETMNPWVMRLVIPLSYLPGVPAGVPHVMAGANGMRLRTYLFLDALGALAVTAAVARIGYASGQAGVDLVVLIDRYALWAVLAIVVGLALVPAFLSSRDSRRRRERALAEAAAAHDAETERGGAGPDTSEQGGAGRTETDPGASESAGPDRGTTARTGTERSADEPTETVETGPNAPEPTETGGTGSDALTSAATDDALDRPPKAPSDSGEGPTPG